MQFPFTNQVEITGKGPSHQLCIWRRNADLAIGMPRRLQSCWLWNCLLCILQGTYICVPDLQVSFVEISFLRCAQFNILILQKPRLQKCIEPESRAAWTWRQSCQRSCGGPSYEFFSADPIAAFLHASDAELQALVFVCQLQAVLVLLDVTLGTC